jgi:hypothetical protein
MEGLDAAPLSWGTANAVPITVSGLVYSLLVGRVACAIRNYQAAAVGTGATQRCYVTSFNVPTANAWIPFSVTIPGCTDGAWPVDNSRALEFSITPGPGSTWVTSTANAWISGQGYIAPAGTLDFRIGSNIYFKELQFERGNVATPFERRHIALERMLCQRYFEKTYGTNVRPGTNVNFAYGGIYLGTGTAGQQMAGSYPFKVTKRIAPRMTGYDCSGASGASSCYLTTTAWTNGQPLPTGMIANENGVTFQGVVANATLMNFDMTFDAEF